MTIHLESNNQIQQNVNAAQENRVEAQPRNEALGNVHASSKLATAGRILLGIVTLGISEGIRALVHHFTARMPAQPRINREPQVRNAPQGNAPRIGSETQVNTAPRTEDAPQAFDLNTLKQPGAKIPANFIQAGKEALQEIYSKFGVTGTADKDLEDTVKSTFKYSSPKNQNMLELGQVKQFFESKKLDFFQDCAKQALKSKVPNFEQSTGCLISSISRRFIVDDQNLATKLQNCANKTDFDALIEDLANRLQRVETKATAIRTDYDAAYLEQAKDFAKQSGIDEKIVLEKLRNNQKLNFSNNVNHNVADFAKEDFSVKDAKDRLLGIVKNTFKDLEASLKTVQSWDLPDTSSYEYIVLDKICVKNEIKGEMAELLGNIAKDDRLCPKDLVGQLLHASSKPQFFQIVQGAIDTMGPVLDEHVANAFKKDTATLGAEDYLLIATVIQARLMPTYNGTDPGPAQLPMLQNLMDAFMADTNNRDNPPIRNALRNVIDAYNYRPNIYTQANLTEGLETLIAQKSGIELKGMEFNLFKANAALILENRSTNPTQKREALQSLAEEYAENQANVLRTIQNSTLTLGMNARLNEVVRSLGACDNELFTNALQHFLVQFAANASKSSIKANEAGLMKLMTKLETDFAKFVKEHLNGTEPTRTDKHFLKQCALSLLAENRKVSQQFNQLTEDQLDKMNISLRDKRDALLTRIVTSNQKDSSKQQMEADAMDSANYFLTFYLKPAV